MLRFTAVAKILLVLTLPFLVHCSGIKTQNLIPDGIGKHQFSTGKSIKSVNVTGEQDIHFGGPYYAKPKHIVEAVTEILSQSRIFNSVGDGQGNLTLNIILRSQTQDGFIPYNAHATLTYRLIDEQDNVVWVRTFESTGSSSAFAGGTRTVKARERSIQANLSAFVDALKTYWDQR